ncbi:MAG: GTP 3',8-cyclase MoaA [Lachnospiraceae bacterium]
MLDARGREINYIRISVTDRCNLRCGYCIPKEGVRLCAHEDLLNFEEIERLVRMFAGIGIRFVKLTGGEPFIRKDFMKLAHRIKDIPGMEKLTVTTNGTFLLPETVPQILNCFDGINVSLDALDRVIYEALSGADGFDRVYNGLLLLIEENDLRKKPVSIKLNCVLTGQNKKEIVKIAGFAKSRKLAVRFIELMPVGLGKEFLEREQLPLQEAEAKRLIEEAYGPLTLLHEKYGIGPAVYYALEGFQGKVGFISALSHKFCSGCNRIRLTADGYLKTCLQYESGIDLRELLRNGKTNEEIRQAVLRTVWNKPSEHAFSEQEILNGENRCMSEIGG